MLLFLGKEELADAQGTNRQSKHLSSCAAGNSAGWSPCGGILGLYT